MDKEGWAELFKYDRLYGEQSEAFADENGRTAYDSDFGRIVFSNHFRRLQDKTQVFPLAKDDSTRTRLTHTLQ